ncbi:MAG: DUF2231 domain-containing protein [Marmoricola sp.]
MDDRATPSPFVRIAQGVEAARPLDAVVRAVDPVAAAVVGDPARASVLQGRWLGHALHPLMTFLPVGTWSSALLLDLVGGRDSRTAAQRLVGIGVLAALPTALTGLAEYADAQPRDRRTGVVHATANTLALVSFTRSWRARRAGDHARGVRLATVGAVFAGVGGFLGGHLTEARKVSSRHPAFAGSS